MSERKYFGTDGIRGRVGSDPITPSFMLRLGAAAGRVLARQGRGKVLIGKDTRISGYMFESALEAGLSAAGVDIELLGPMPTPGVAYLTRTLRAQAGIVISASHNPYHDNGIKFFSAEGTKLPDDVEVAIERELDGAMETVDSALLGKARRINDAVGRYIEFCKSTVTLGLRLTGLRIVLDCANGATYQIAPSVFSELGAEVTTIASQPDGLNINAGCGSTHPEALAEAVRHRNADLGIAFDGDGDRVIMVDDRGQIVDGDQLLYLIALARHQQGALKGCVVGTQMTNLGMEMRLRAHGIGLERTRVGDRYIMEALIREGWNLGGESSGHIICLDRTSTGDGIVSALQVLESLCHRNCSLRDAVSDVTLYPQTMINVPLPDGIDVMGEPGVGQAVAETESVLNGRGRVLLRPSGTEPVVRVMVEGEDGEEVAALAESLAQRVQETVEQSACHRK
ncbi:MAG: phosphoglucosamine mutase [Gammaproteobacteria bacterium]